MTHRPKVKPLIAVTGSDRPYIYDLPHMLSLPAGFEFRFRYRHSWVETGLREQIVNNADSLRGRTVIVVFHSASQKRLVPVRRCRVVSLDVVGAIMYLRFSVGEFVSAPRNPAAAGPVPASSVWNDLHELSRRLFGAEIDAKDLSKPLGNGFYLRVASGEDPTDQWSGKKGAAAAEEWSVLAQVLGEEYALWDVPMFYLLGFQREGGDYARAGRLLARSAYVKVAWWRRQPTIVANKLVEGERYRLRLLEWCELVKPIAVNVTCKFDERMLQLESAASLVVGRYDILEFSMLAKQSGFCYLEVRADPDEKAPTSPDWPRLYAARVPIRVRNSVVRLAVVITLGLGGLAVYQWATTVATATKVPESVCQLVGTILIFVVLGEVVDRFLKFSKGLREHAQPPTYPAAKP